MGANDELERLGDSKSNSRREKFNWGGEKIVFISAGLIFSIEKNGERV